MTEAFQRPGPHINYSTAITGTALCIADAWGHNHPVPSTTVELEDHNPVFVTPGASNVLDSQPTAQDGTFTVGANRNLRAGTWALRFINDFTGQTVIKDAKQILTLPTTTPTMPGLASVQYDLGRIILPWDPQLSVLAKVDGREFTDHADLARSLGIALKQAQSSVWLLHEFDLSDPRRDRDLDAMFRALEVESATGSTGLVDRIAREVAKAVPINPFKLRNAHDVFALALEQTATTRIRPMKVFVAGVGLGDAIKKAFGSSSTPMAFLDLRTGMAAACVLLFVAGCIAKGRKVSVRLSSLTAMTFKHLHRHYKMIDIAIS